MATKLSNLPIEISHFHNYVQHIPTAKNWDTSTVADLLDLGMIQVSTGFEQAVAAAGGHTVVSEDAGDLSNGVDCKMTTAGKLDEYRYCAQVQSFAGKTGGLDIQVYERKKNKFYYFTIPRSAYEEIPAGSSIKIHFEEDGTPRRNSGSSNAKNWWKYEVKTFQEMAKFNG